MQKAGRRLPAFSCMQICHCFLGIVFQPNRRVSRVLLESVPLSSRRRYAVSSRAESEGVRLADDHLKKVAFFAGVGSRIMTDADHADKIRARWVSS